MLEKYFPFTEANQGYFLFLGGFYSAKWNPLYFQMLPFLREGGCQPGSLMQKWWMFQDLMAFYRRNRTCSVWTELCPSKSHRLRSEPPGLQNVGIFGDRAFKEIVKVKWVHAGGPTSYKPGVLLRESLDTDIHRGMIMRGHREETASASQGKQPQEKPTLPTPSSQTSRTVRKYISVVLATQPVAYNLLWLLKQINSSRIYINVYLSIYPSIWCTCMYLSIYVLVLVLRNSFFKKSSPDDMFIDFRERGRDSERGTSVSCLPYVPRSWMKLNNLLVYRSVV